MSVFDRVENILGKGEIARISNFSFSQDVVKKASFPGLSKGVIVWATDCDAWLGMWKMIISKM